ncbi:MAG: hypothetical protein GY754_04290 [bacterium]|nr:hypothetical protein [bacterium]
MKLIKKSNIVLIFLLISLVFLGCSNDNSGQDGTKVASPVFSKAKGTYSTNVDIELNCSTEGAVIYYTTNGDEPATSSNLYNGAAISFEKYGNPVTIKAIAVKDGLNDSDIVSASYTLESTVTTEHLYNKTILTGGSGTDYGYCITTDSENNIIAAGEFSGTNVDFDPGTGTDSHSSNGERDVFISKFASDGSYLWTKTLGGSGYDGCKNIVVDKSNNIYVAGYFQEADVDFNPGPGTDLHSSTGRYSCFLTKLESDGDYVRTIVIDGQDSDSHCDAAIDSSGNIFLTGSFSGTDIDFNPGTGSDLHSTNGANDIFVTKFSSDFSYEWTVTIGGSINDFAQNITSDSYGNVIVAGVMASDNVDFNPGDGEDIESSNGSYDVFVAKINSDGSYAWAHSFGGTYIDWNNGIAVDSGDNIFLTGYFHRTNVDFDPGPEEDIHSSKNSSCSNIYVSKYSTNGTYLWTKTVGGTTGDHGYDITVDKFDNIFFTGTFSGTNVDFDPGTGEDLYTSNSGRDVFVTRFNSDSTYSWTKTITGSGFEGSEGIAIDSLNNIFVTGQFYGTNVDFDPGTGTDYYSSSPTNAYDVFIWKLSSE